MACRFVHLTATGFLSGTIIISHVFQMTNVLRDQPSYSLLCALAGVLLILSGIANVFIIKMGKTKT